MVRKIVAKAAKPKRRGAQIPSPLPVTRAPVEAVVRPARGSLSMALLRRFLDADLLSQAAALAFYTVLSLAPLLLLLLWLSNTFLPSSQHALLDQIGQLVGSDARRVAQSIVDAAKDGPDTRSIAGWLSILLMFVGATAVFAQLQDVLNKIFRTDATHLLDAASWLRKRIFSFGLVFAIGFLLLISLTATTALQLIFARAGWMLPVAAMASSWLVYTLGFAVMYRYLPDRRVHWRRALLGGAVTSLLFMAGRSGIAWYLKEVDPTSGYGAMGALALALLWVYYASLVLFLGALLTAVIDERRSPVPA